MNATERAVELAKPDGYWRARWLGTAIYWLSVAVDEQQALVELENELRDTYAEETGGAEVDWQRVAAVLMQGAAQ